MLYFSSYEQRKRKRTPCYERFWIKIRNRQNENKEPDSDSALLYKNSFFVIQDLF